MERIITVFLVLVTYLCDVDGQGQQAVCPRPCTNGRTCALIKTGNSLALEPGCTTPEETAMLHEAMRELERQRLEQASPRQPWSDTGAGVGQQQIGGGAGVGQQQFEGGAGVGQQQFGGGAGVRQQQFGGGRGVGQQQIGGGAGVGQQPFRGGAGVGQQQFGGGAGVRQQQFGGGTGAGQQQIGGDAGVGQQPFRGGAGVGQQQFGGGAGVGQQRFGGSTMQVNRGALSDILPPSLINQLQGGTARMPQITSGTDPFAGQQQQGTGMSEFPNLSRRSSFNSFGNPSERFPRGGMNPSSTGREFGVAQVDFSGGQLTSPADTTAFSSRFDGSRVFNGGSTMMQPGGFPGSSSAACPSEAVGCTRTEQDGCEVNEFCYYNAVCDTNICQTIQDVLT